ncbi:hypothetical protein ACHAXN_011473 [Cyclotella atomus]|jgi:hypothetical protein
MGAGKNKSHRKKRISKHVLQSEERKKEAQLENKLISAAGGNGETLADSPVEKQSSDTKNSKVKDPQEAASYLTLWNHDRTNKSGAWKFNKNTQSWLLRHMYNSDKVNKQTFGLLVEYICQGGEGTRSRVEEDAKQKAIRYKEWEKKQQQQSNGEDGKDDEVQAETPKGAKNESKTEEEAWAELNEHDKRKEYKRARKVIDALKDVREKEKAG